MRVAVFLNGDKIPSRILPCDKVICADGGYDFCPLPVDLFVGDGDSLTSALSSNIAVDKYDSHKNDTDGTLAVHRAIEFFSATEIDIYGAVGGRPDHVLGNLTLLSLAKDLGATAVLRGDDFDCYLTDKKLTITTELGDTISVIPYGGNAILRSACGVEYQIDNLLFTPSDTRGISNVATSKAVTLDVAEGTILVFHFLCHN